MDSDTLLARQHHADHTKPLAKVLICILKDRAGDIGETIAAVWRAAMALPLEGRCSNGADFFAQGTAGAANAIGPTVRDQICGARILLSKHLLELSNRHLWNAGHVDH